MPSRNLADLHPILVAAYTKAAAEYAVQHPTRSQPFITCTFRGQTEQNAAYASGASNAKWGQSPHNYRPALAFDIAFGKATPVDWNMTLFRNFWNIIRVIEPRIRWGCNFKKLVDGPHFELANWRNYLPIQ